MELESISTRYLLNKGKTKVYFDNALDGVAEVIKTAGISDAVLKLSNASFGLLLLQDMETVEMTCSAIEHIRKFYKVPIIVFQTLENAVVEPYII